MVRNTRALNFYRLEIRSLIRNKKIIAEFYGLADLEKRETMFLIYLSGQRFSIFSDLLLINLFTWNFSCMFLFAIPLPLRQIQNSKIHNVFFLFFFFCLRTLNQKKLFLVFLYFSFEMEKEYYLGWNVVLPLPNQDEILYPNCRVVIR